MERERSDRLTVAKLNSVSKLNKQDYKSKLLTEKYSLVPINPQPLTPVQTTLQTLTEKHPDFEIKPAPSIWRITPFISNNLQSNKFHDSSTT